jgi:hypothetical protein
MPQHKVDTRTINDNMEKPAGNLQLGGPMDLQTAFEK